MRKSQDDIARIIAPFEWRQYDAALRPYTSNRGAMGELEPFWYQVTWGMGLRSAGEVDSWFRVDKLTGSEPGIIFSFRDSLIKAEAILNDNV